MAALGITPHLSRRVAALEHWRDTHEGWSRDERNIVERDISQLVQAVSDLRDELHADRSARLELGTMNTEAILEGFKEAARGIVAEVIKGAEQDRHDFARLLQALSRRLDKLEAQ